MSDQISIALYDVPEYEYVPGDSSLALTPVETMVVDIPIPGAGIHDVHGVALWLLDEAPPGCRSFRGLDPDGGYWAAFVTTSARDLEPGPVTYLHLHYVTARSSKKPCQTGLAGTFRTPDALRRVVYETAATRWAAGRYGQDPVFDNLHTLDRYARDPRNVMPACYREVPMGTGSGRPRANCGGCVLRSGCGDGDQTVPETGPRSDDTDEFRKRLKKKLSGGYK